MSDPNAVPGGYGHPSSVPPMPQQAPGYGYPQSGQGYPPAPQAGYPMAPQGGYYNAPGYGMQQQPSNGLGTAGMVCGIIGVVLSLTFILWWAGMILGILAIIFGAIGRGRAKRGEATNKGAATSGLVLGIVATVILPLLGLLLFASFMSAVSGAS
ncbi:DUF4190 domain-containing protein [Streptomyces sp. NPDC048664]|uniref:DUF4190 domain-containing protein n=1 Tax=Streptomyces sp. NPDC048664 TaxID=3154505 RepID=UPI003423A9D8